MAGRRGEKKAVHFRSDRIHYINGAWYFSVREHHELIGPYSTKASAEMAVNAFIRDILRGVSPQRAFSNQLLAEHFSLI